MLLEYSRAKNFRSYVDQELDLSGITAAVITGQTGAGKSTLVSEGPLWANYGIAQGRDFLRLGCDTCSFETRFRTEDGSLYRTIRTYSTKGSRTKSDLSFAVFAGDGVRPFAAEGLLLIASRLVTGRMVRYVDANGKTVGEEVVA